MDFYPSLDCLRLYEILKTELKNHQFKFEFNDETFDAYVLVGDKENCIYYAFYVDSVDYGITGYARYFGINEEKFDYNVLSGVIKKANERLPFGVLGVEGRLYFRYEGDNTEIELKPESVAKFVEKFLSAATKQGTAFKDLLCGKISFTEYVAIING